MRSANMHPPSFLPLLLSIIVATLTRTHSSTHDDPKVYIVYMGSLPKGDYSPSAHHQRILKQVVEGRSPVECLVRSYTRSFNGFSAKLTHHEQQKLSKMEGIVSVFRSRTLKLHTTRSWDFMGFPLTVKRSPSVESDIVVGVIDTGVWPESYSFSDVGFGPPPPKWKGVCNGGTNFTCNNKLIGARVYSSNDSSVSARDTEGHGTHTASTAAGNKVGDASFYGLAPGNARGAVPSARVAVYKTCWDSACSDTAILAAFDDAISDGVDMLSVSLGPQLARDYFYDSIGIGSFHAMRNGIVTSNSAGNDGPDSDTVSSVAPWMLTVGASSTDRQIIDKVILGDGKTFVGKAVNTFDMHGKKFPLIYGGDASNSDDKHIAQFCNYGSFDRNLVQGKIVFCDVLSLGTRAFDTKAVGIIMEDKSSSDFASTYPLPASLLSVRDGERLKIYINSTKKPEATITKSEILRDADAPVVVSFSSRGPSSVMTDILKPDITAPGVDILAAWSPVSSPTQIQYDKRSVKYNILSGTSMSCPHATGSAAYVKSFHPDWSSAAIKSALMTTAFPMKGTKSPGREFAYGSGHINPAKAINPGLVYDAGEDDYIQLLCHYGWYTSKQIRLVSGDNSSCPRETRAPKDLNYPSMATDIRNSSFTRTVTNVGSANSTYTATTTSEFKVKITVNPDVLSFKSLNEKRSFVVKVYTEEKDSIVTASLVWSDGIHSVRSPIVMY